MADITPTSKPKVYLETTIPSYLTSRPSRDLQVAAHQQLTNDWWVSRRHRFALFVSPPVMEEAGAGDAAAAGRRLAELSGIPILEFTAEANELGKRFMAEHLIPVNAVQDAMHVAIAAVHAMDYLLTWNCRHIANAENMTRLVRVTAAWGYSLPILCTPEQLMGE